MVVKKETYSIIWDRKALDNFKEILEYLSQKSLSAPGIVKESILDKISLLEHNPFLFEIDKLKNNPSENFRAFVSFSYRIAYQIVESKRQIRILRIRHTSREPLGY